MLFKNLLLFRLLEAPRAAPETWSKALSEHAFRPCASLEPSSSGWTSPLGRHSDELVHIANGCALICMRREDRLLPPAVVREALDERIDAIESNESRTVGARERRRMRDDVIFELMPRAFTRSTHVYAYLTLDGGWLVVDSASVKTAEELLVLLGHSLNGLPVEPFEGSESPVGVLTRWLDTRRLPDGFSFADECELRDPADKGAVVRCQRQDLTSAEIRAHLDAHKRVERLALGFEDSMTFVLGADLSVRRLRFTQVDELDRMDELDEIARIDANFVYMSSEVNRLLSRLQSLFAP